MSLEHEVHPVHQDPKSAQVSGGCCLQDVCQPSGQVQRSHAWNSELLRKLQPVVEDLRWCGQHRHSLILILNLLFKFAVSSRPSWTDLSGRADTCGMNDICFWPTSVLDRVWVEKYESRVFKKQVCWVTPDIEIRQTNGIQRRVRGLPATFTVCNSKIFPDWLYFNSPMAELGWSL